MNTIQKCVLAITLIAMSIVIVVPPWTGKYTEERHRAGKNVLVAYKARIPRGTPIFSPPPPSYAPGHLPDIMWRLDYSRLGIELLIIGALGVVLLLILQGIKLKSMKNRPTEALLQGRRGAMQMAATSEREEQKHTPTPQPELPPPGSRSRIQWLWGSTIQCPFCGNRDIKHRHLSLFYLPSILPAFLFFLMGLTSLPFWDLDLIQSIAQFLVILALGIALMLLAIYLLSPHGQKWTHGNLACFIYGASALGNTIFHIILTVGVIIDPKEKLTSDIPLLLMITLLDVLLILAFVAVWREQYLCHCRNCGNAWDTPHQAVREFERKRLNKTKDN